MESGLGISCALAFQGGGTGGREVSTLPEWTTVPGAGAFLAVMSSSPNSPVLASAGDGMAVIQE